MKKNIFLGIIISFLLLNCSQQNSELSIVGGSNAIYRPYFAGITFSKKSEQINCGATFIEKRILITAAHCFQSLFYNMQYVRVGIGDQNQKDKFLKIESIIVHEKWNWQNETFDIAMIKVEDYEEEELGVKISPIEIDTDPHFISDQWTNTLKVVGSGSISSYGSLQDIKIKQADLKLMPLKQCKGEFKRYGVKESFDEKIICTGEANVAALAPCKGDSGSPLVATVNGKEILVGIEFTGIGYCGQTGSPAAYNKVAMYATWIREKKSFLQNPVSNDELSEKLIEFHKAGCFYNLSQVVEKASDNYNHMQYPNFKIRNIITPTSYARQVNRIFGELVSTSYPCRFEVPFRGAFNVEVRFDGVKLNMFAVNENEIWEINTSFETPEVQLACDNYTFLEFNELSFYSESFDHTTYYLHTFEKSPPFLLESNIIRQCGFGSVSITLYDVMENDNVLPRFAMSKIFQELC